MDRMKNSLIYPIWLDFVFYLYYNVYMNMKQLTQKEIRALRIIRNAIIHRGSAPSVRGLMEELGYRSPRSASIIIESLSKKGYLTKRKDGTIKLTNDYGSCDRAATVNIPLIGEVACGYPILADENIEAYMSVSIKLAKPPHNYFLLRTAGDSMNARGINDGDLVLIRQQCTASNGELILALIDEEATIKEFHRAGDTVILMPKSNNPIHKPILLSEDFRIQGIVKAVISIGGQGDKDG
jgi:repressor LexA